jgi:hypothetical protein
MFGIALRQQNQQAISRTARPRKTIELAMEVLSSTIEGDGIVNLVHQLTITA